MKLSSTSHMCFCPVVVAVLLSGLLVLDFGGGIV